MRSRDTKKYAILVSGASGIVGYGILRTLKKRDDCFLIGTTIYEESPANCFSDVVEVVPRSDDPAYIPALLSLIKKYYIDMIIPGIEADMSAWCKYRSDIESSGTILMINNTELIDLCLDKWKFYQRLEDNSYDGRILSALERNFYCFKTPFILKPRCGFGARGLVKVENKEQFDVYSQDIGSNLMMQEFVGNEREEYTISAFFDASSTLMAIMGMKRKLSSMGFTEMAEVVDTGEFVSDIEKLSEIFKPIGPTNFQFRKQNGRLKLLEINPRVSSSTSIRCKFGYNESSMAVDYFLSGKEIIQPEIKRGKAMRYTEDYIFYDSTDI